MNFVDTGIFVALNRRQDQYRAEALRLWPSLERPVTSNHVVGEVATTLGRFVGYGFGAECAKAIFHSKDVEVLQATREDEIQALNWMRKYADQGVGFTDGVSFAMMRRLKIRTAFTFDRHFRLAGFDVVGLK